MEEGKRRDLGLFILRVGIGAMFVGHGLPKLLGGPERWRAVGSATRHLGVELAAAPFGLLAGLAEAGGGALLAIGLWFRPACVAMLATMVVASISHLSQGDSFARSSHAIEAAILFLSLALVGPGRYRVRFGP